MRGLDEWLEAPYVNAARLEEWFERWCETEEPDLDFEDEAAVAAAWGRYEAAVAGE